MLRRFDNQEAIYGAEQVEGSQDSRIDRKAGMKKRRYVFGRDVITAESIQVFGTPSRIE